MYVKTFEYVNNDSPYEPYLYVLIVSNFIFTFLFSLSHWLLAEKYYSVSLETPYAIHEVKAPKRNHCSRRKLNCIMITLNTLSVFLDIGPYWYTVKMSLSGKTVPKALLITSEICYFPFLTMLSISGFLLLNSVRKIRSYLVEHD